MTWAFLAGVAHAGSLTVFPPPAGGLTNAWTVLDWADRQGAEYDPNSLGTMSGAGSTITCTINDATGRTDVKDGTGVYFDFYDAEGSQVWLPTTGEADWPFALTVIVEAVGTMPNASGLAALAVIVDDDGDLSIPRKRLGVGVDFQSATPRRIAAIQTTESYGTANADMRSSLMTLGVTGVASSASMVSREFQYAAITEFKADKVIFNKAWLNLGSYAWVTSAGANGPQLWVGCTAFAAMAAEASISFHVAYQWVPAILDANDKIVLPSEL